VANRVSLSKRVFLAVCLAAAASFVLVPGASAGNFDEQKMGCAGESPATCPEGTVGKPYSLTIYVMPPNDERGEDFGCMTFAPTSGTFPPGLSISDEGYITGNPTQPGTYEFYLTARMDKELWCAETCGSKCSSDDNFIIKINPGVPTKPKLTIGPEATSPGTVGSAYSLSMTANLPDAKTWSIASGSLPPGLAIGSSTGIISGTPLAAGSFTFTVLSVLDAERSDTKSLTIDVRERLVITPPDEFDARRIARTEVGVDFLSSLSATGGFGAYTWSSDDLPPGFDLDADGTIAGDPEVAGSFRFTVAVTDEENRRAAYTARIVVAERLGVVTKKFRTGKVGRRYQAKIVARGGVLPLTFKIKRGTLPRGIFFDPSTGTFFGTPVKAGTWKIAFEIVDGLGVKAKGTIKIVVAPALKT
jgi:large repetitive protein